MAKTSKKTIGAAMAGVMAVGAVAGAVNAVDQVKVANAAESQALKDAKAKISHLTWSLKNNYLGLKNQAQWEVYIKEARVLIGKIPAAEKAEATALTDEVNRANELVKALARINHVEKSMDVNFHGIKNAKQWNEYLRLGEEALKEVNKEIFADQYAELVERLGKCSTVVDKVIEDFKVEYDAAVKLFDAAKESRSLEDAEKALKAAEALGTVEESDKLEADIKQLIEDIKNGVEADKEAPVITVNGEKTITVENGDKLTLPEVTATDNVDKEVEVKKVIKDSKGNTIESIDTKVSGTYTVTYSATDKAGNKAEDVVVTVTVKEAKITVETIKTINSTEVEVKFNKEVKADTVKPAAFKVTDKDGNMLFVSKAEVKKDDAKIVTLSFFDAFKDKGEYTVVTSNIADKDGNVMTNSTNKFEYAKSEISKVEFTSTTVKPGTDLRDVIKVTDKLGRDVTKEQKANLKFTSADSTVVNNGIAQSLDNKETIVTVKVGDTDVTAKTVIKVKNAVAKTFAGYTTAKDNAPVNTDEFKKLSEDKIFNYVSMNDKDSNAKTLNVYTLDQYGKSMEKNTDFESVNNLTPNVVIVEQNGTIKPISVGTGYVKVKIGDVEQTIQIDVRKTAEVTNVSFDKQNVNVVAGGLSETVKVTYNDQYNGETPGDASKLTVKSSDTEIATVTKNGNNIVVNGVKEGTAKITAVYKYTNSANKEVEITKEISVTVAAKGEFADYKAEVDRTVLYSENDTTTDIDETTTSINVYKVDNKGQKIEKVEDSSVTLVALDKDGNEISNDSTKVVTINGTTITYKAEGTEKVAVKINDYVVDTITIETINNTKGAANSAEFNNLAVVFGEVNADDTGITNANILTELQKIVDIKDKFGSLVNVDDATKAKVKFKYEKTNVVGFNSDLTKLTASNASADLVITEVTYDDGTDNLISSPVVVKLSAKDTKAPELTEKSITSVTKINTSDASKVDKIEFNITFGEGLSEIPANLIKDEDISVTGDNIKPDAVNGYNTQTTLEDGNKIKVVMDIEDIDDANVLGGITITLPNTINDTVGNTMSGTNTFTITLS